MIDKTLIKGLALNYYGLYGFLLLSIKVRKLLDQKYWIIEIFYQRVFFFEL